ncbi:MAG: Gldg family protein [Candidatus Muiribacteriaceae bacterium]
MNRKRFRIDNLVNLIIIIVIVVVINMLANLRYVKTDMTENLLNSLRPSTSKVLEKVDEPLTIFSFFRAGTQQYRKAVNTLQLLKDENRNIKVVISDIDADPEEAMRLGVSEEKLVFVYGERVEESPSPAEERIAASIARLVNTKVPEIYYVTGHGERDIEASGDDTFWEFRNTIENQGFSFNSLLLTGGGGIPDDCDLLIIGAPEKTYLEEEIKLIKEYIERDGRLLVFLEPSVQNGEALSGILYEFGLYTLDGIVLDFGRNLSKDQTIPAVNRYLRHFITRNIAQTFFPVSRGLFRLKREDRPNGEFNIEYIATGVRGKSYVDSYNPEGNYLFDFEKSQTGVPALVVASEKTHRVKDGELVPMSAKGVFFGDSNLVTGRFIDKMGNIDLVLSSIDWLLSESDIVSVGRESGNRRYVSLTNIAQKKIFYISIVFIPLLIAFTGILVVYRREKE